MNVQSVEYELQILVSLFMTAKYSAFFHVDENVAIKLNLHSLLHIALVWHMLIKVIICSHKIYTSGQNPFECRLLPTFICIRFPESSFGIWHILLCQNQHFRHQLQRAAQLSWMILDCCC